MFSVLLTVFFVNCYLITVTNAATLAEREELAKYFQEVNVGTFVMYDETGDQYIVFNAPQSTTRLAPCSSFKIYNSFAGLETGVLE